MDQQQMRTRGGPQLQETLPRDTERSGDRSDGIKNILAGLVLIGIGFAYGGSMFLGTADGFDYFFDVLGSVWVLRGVYQLVH